MSFILFRSQIFMPTQWCSKIIIITCISVWEMEYRQIGRKCSCPPTRSNVPSDPIESPAAMGATGHRTESRAVQWPKRQRKTVQHQACTVARSLSLRCVVHHPTRYLALCVPRAMADWPARAFVAFVCTLAGGRLAPTVYARYNVMPPSSVRNAKYNSKYDQMRWTSRKSCRISHKISIKYKIIKTGVRSRVVMSNAKYKMWEVDQ